MAAPVKEVWLVFAVDVAGRYLLGAFSTQEYAEKYASYKDSISGLRYRHVVVRRVVDHDVQMALVEASEAR